MHQALKVGLFALSDRPLPEKLSSGIEHLRMATGLEVLPIVPEWPPCRNFAGDDAYRARQFNELVQDPALDGLIAIRGGYGAGRVLDAIDFDALRKSGKFVCGYSDVTALLMAAWKNGCRHLIHGPMICSSWAENPLTDSFKKECASFLDVLHHRPQLMPPWAAPQVLQSGEAQGPLLPCNLSLLQAALATPYLPDFHGAILAIEDITSPAHAIDRALNQLRQAGILAQLSALIFGQFTQTEDAEYLPEILVEYTQLIHGPVLANYPFGHEHPSVCIPYGISSRLHADSCSIELNEENFES